MNGDNKPSLKQGLEAYGSKFENLDELMVPQLMTDERFPAFLVEAAAADRPATRESVERVFGPVSWDW